MGGAFKPQFDKIIHERVRLSILAYLSSSSAAAVSFTKVKEDLDLTSGNLSIQLRNLEEAGYVKIAKSFVENKSNTAIHLTVRGSQALAEYLSEMEMLIQTLRRGEAPDGTSE